MSQKAKLAQAFMSIAAAMSRVSACSRGKHACVLVSRSLRVVSIGYNGPASRLPNQCARPDEPGSEGRGCGCVHAEVNACIQGRIENPFYAFCTAAPCEACAQVLINAGVRVVVYDRLTASGGAGIQRLTLAGVGCFDFDNFPPGSLGLGA